MKYAEIKEYARYLRKNPTPAESELWKHLRNRQLEGRKFLRQHPLLYQFYEKEYFYFMPDFYCYQELLVIELDGPIHNFQLDRDSKRESILIQTGFKVIRFKNEELNDMVKVLNTIKKQFKPIDSPFTYIGEGGQGDGLTTEIKGVRKIAEQRDLKVQGG